MTELEKKKHQERSPKKRNLRNRQNQGRTKERGSHQTGTLVPTVAECWISSSTTPFSVVLRIQKDASGAPVLNKYSIYFTH